MEKENVMVPIYLKNKDVYNKVILEEDFYYSEDNLSKLEGNILEAVSQERIESKEKVESEVDPRNLFDPTSMLD